MLWIWVLIAGWGLCQLAARTTVYRYVTWGTASRMTALHATAFIAARTLVHHKLRIAFLRAFSFAGAGISILAVLNRLTGEGKLLWLIAAPYPDVWGPFLSRNDFAAFVELSFPVVFWFGIRSCQRSPPQVLPEAAAEKRRVHAFPGFVYLGMSAFMVAAVAFSASRAGSLLVLFEGIVLLGLVRWRWAIVFFVVFLTLFIAVMGASTLLSRIGDVDLVRANLFRSTIAMIAERPWAGSGLGTYVTVYPKYARFDSGARVDHAHNEWLEWAAEGGIPYAVLFALGCGSIARRAIRSVWGIGVFFIFLHAMVDYPFARLGITAWTFSLMGILSVDEMRKVVSRNH